MGFKASEAKREPDLASPEVEVAEVDVELVVGLRVRQVPEVADVALEAHVTVAREERRCPPPTPRPSSLLSSSKSPAASSTRDLTRPRPAEP